MSDQIPVVEAFRVMTANKSLSDQELHELIKDGIHAALARRFGGPVEAEITIVPGADIKIVVLKEVVEAVEDPAREVSLEEVLEVINVTNFKIMNMHVKEDMFARVTLAFETLDSA